MKSISLVERTVRRALNEAADISPRQIYYAIGDAVQDIRYLASSEQNDPELVKLYNELKTTHAKVKATFDKKYGKWD